MSVRFQCPSCGQRLEAPVEASGNPLPCPACGAPLVVPAADAGAVPSRGELAREAVCGICQSPIGTDEAQKACSTCQSNYHAECWDENGGCAVYGCAEVPKVESRRSIEIPISYWGQENKPCPSCGFEILAAAVRCRNCGATFSSARPEEADEYHERQARNERLPAMKRTVVWLFVFSAIPCLAPIGAIWGLIWYSLNRRTVQSMPSVYPALSKIGLALAIGQCVLIAVMAALYAATQEL